MFFFCCSRKVSDVQRWFYCVAVDEERRRGLRTDDVRFIALSLKEVGVHPGFYCGERPLMRVETVVRVMDSVERYSRVSPAWL